MTEYLSSDYQTFIHLSKYSRWVEEKNRRETWEETVNRYIAFFTEHLEGRCGYSLTKAEKSLISNSILGLTCMPSMRCLMTAGQALKRDEVAGFNCSATAIDDIKVFDEIMFVLMCGTGMGFSVEHKFIEKLPWVADEFDRTDTTIIVADSRIGWAKSLRELISLLYAGRIPQWDLSKVRSAGTRLKTFGGRASGPAPLDNMFKFAVNLFQNARGRRLTSLECHDLVCKIAECIVVGGVRRSALISLSDLEDDKMREAKFGAWYAEDADPHRALANNSAVYESKPDIGTFLKEWSSLYNSKSGERGIFSRKASNNQAHRTGRRKPHDNFLTNPCFSGDMKLLTVDGYIPFSRLDGQMVHIVNETGQVSQGKVWRSGNKKTVKISWQRALGKEAVICTPDHVFKLVDGTSCEAKDLKGEQVKFYAPVRKPEFEEDFLMGFCLGDANLNRLNSDHHLGIDIYFQKSDIDIVQAYNFELKGHTAYSREASKLASEYGLPASVIGGRGFPDSLRNSNSLCGLFSANGSVITKYRVALKSIDLEQIKVVKEFLHGEYGIESYITINKAHKNQFSNGEYECRESYDLNISRYNSLRLFAKHISFGQEYKRKALVELLSSRCPKVMNVKSHVDMDVYDFSEPLTNWGIVEGIVAHNCSEIILRPRQMCNLSDIVCRPDDTLASLKKKTKIATIMGTIQSTLTTYRYLSSRWKKNNEEERLLGVSLTGIMDNPMLNGTYFKKHKNGDWRNHLGDWLGQMKQEAIKTNKVWAKKLGIESSASITCVKPSGTVSQLVNSGSGIHPRHNDFYIRRVRGDKKDPLTLFMMNSGFPFEYDITNPAHLVVFSFPIKTDPGALIRKDLTAIDHLDLWKVYQDHWCDHKPSITVSVKEHEWMDVGAWVYRNFDEVSGVSFLPYSEHIYKQAPYEDIDSEQYESMLAKMPKNINWADLSEYEVEDTTAPEGELSCHAGGCEL